MQTITARPSLVRAQAARPASSSRVTLGSRVNHQRSIAVRAEGEFDFDKMLADGAERFEKSENKGIVVAYGVGAVAAIFSAEWLIHLPLFNFLVGFPIQLLGLLVLPSLGLRYFVNKEATITGDVEAEFEKITKELPGLK